MAKTNLTEKKQAQKSSIKKVYIDLHSLIPNVHKVLETKR